MSVALLAWDWFIWFGCLASLATQLFVFTTSAAATQMLGSTPVQNATCKVLIGPHPRVVTSTDCVLQLSVLALVCVLDISASVAYDVLVRRCSPLGRGNFSIDGLNGCHDSARYGFTV